MFALAKSASSSIISAVSVCSSGMNLMNMPARENVQVVGTLGHCEHSGTRLYIAGLL